MGLFDGYPQGGPFGGLLQLLASGGFTPQDIRFQSGLASDQAQYGPQTGSQPAPIFSQPMAPQQQPAQPMAAAPQGAPAYSGMSIGDRLTSALRGAAANAPAGPLGVLFGGAAGLAGLGQGNEQTQQAAAMTQFLRSHGVPEPDILAAVGNGNMAGNQDVLKTILANNVKDKAEIRPATPAERSQAFGGSDNGQPLYIETNTGKPIFGPAQTNVNVSTEKTGQAELAKTGVEAYVAAQNAARDAQKRIGLYDQFQKAADGFTPGATAEARLAAKRYLKDAGLIKGDDVPDGEIMQMISRQLAIHAQPKGQGAVSNYERELYASSLPNMTQSPEGLKRAIEINRKLETFDQKVAEIYRDSARANRGLPNYLDVQDKIAALGSPLDDNDWAAIRSGGQPTKTTPTLVFNPKSGRMEPAK